MIRDPKLSKLNDERLIQEYRKRGGSAPVQEMFGRYGHQIYGNCLKYFKSEDLSEEAMPILFGKLPGLMAETSDTPFKQRLYLMVKDYCLAQVKALGKPREASESVAAGIGLSDIEESERVEREVAKLNKAERQCVELHLLEGKSLKEVSEITGYSMEEVKVQVEKGKRSLQKRLGEDEQ